MGAGRTRNFCVKGTARVRGFPLLQCDDVETWNERAVRTKDHVLGRTKSSLPGRCHERDGCRVTARGASEGRGLGRRAREIAVRSTKDSAQLGEEVAARAHRDEFRDWFMVVSNRDIVVNARCVDSFTGTNFIFVQESMQWA